MKKFSIDVHIIRTIFGDPPLGKKISESLKAVFRKFSTTTTSDEKVNSEGAGRYECNKLTDDGYFNRDIERVSAIRTSTNS